VASLVVNTFPQAFLEVLHHSLQHVGRNCCHFFPDVLFQIHHCPWFLFIHPALEISSEEEVLRLGTLVPMNIEVPTKYPLSQDRIVVFEIRLHSKSPMLYRPALHGNWNALSLARRALKDKFPTPTVPLTTVLQNRQLFLPDPVEGLQTSVLFYCRCISVMCDYHLYFVIVILNLHVYRLLLLVLMAFCFEYWLIEDDTDTSLEQWLALSVLYIFAFCCPTWQGNLLIFPCSPCLLR